ncbi:MAG: hypothetical protein KAH32_07350 [Chlamydiia bacterium]|nr:hypothetical protein [Chlamydiia bacterium]
MEKQRTVLESSTNTHATESKVKVVKEFVSMTTMVIDVIGDSMIVEHGHHRTVATEPETKRVIKITQQEFNPLTKKLQNAFD